MPPGAYPRPETAYENGRFEEPPQPSESHARGAAEELRDLLTHAALSMDESQDILAVVRSIASGLEARTARPTPEFPAPSQLRLLEGTDLLGVIIGQLNAADAMCTSMVCRKFRDAIYLCYPLPEYRDDGRFGKEAAKPDHHVTSVSRFHWARSMGGLSSKLTGLRGSGPGKHGVCAATARIGNLEVLQEARKHNYAWNADTVASAAEHGHIHIVKYCRNTALGDDRCPWDETTCAAAAQGGHLDILRWARTRKCKWDSTTCSAAAAYGNIEILKWARKHNCPWDDRVPASAVEGEQLESFFWLVQHGCPFADMEVCLKAAKYGLVPVLEHVASENPAIISSDNSRLMHICVDAARHGKVQVLDWALESCSGLLEQDPPWHPGGAHTTFGTHIMEVAAMTNHVNVLDWGVAHDRELPPAMLIPVIDHGHIDVVRWAKSKGMEMPSAACKIACRRTDLPMLQYLRSIDCPWGNNPLGAPPHPGPSRAAQLRAWALANGAPDGTGEERDDPTERYHGHSSDDDGEHSYSYGDDFEQMPEGMPMPVLGPFVGPPGGFIGGPGFGPPPPGFGGPPFPILGPMMF